MNELFFVLNVVISLGGAVALYKIFGKNGLFVYSVFGTIISSVATCKVVPLFGSAITAGTVFYASTFLVTDILSEKYGKKEAEKAVWYGIAGMIFWVIGTQMMLLFSPVSRTEGVDEHMKALFGMVPRIFSSSMVANVCSQSFDVFMYHFIWGKTGNSKKMLWLRNNGSTMLSQAIDTTIFSALAFVGVLPIDLILSISISNYLFKALVAFLDTPFMYLARKVVPLNEKRSMGETKSSTEQLEVACA